jgi:hypothetical protein
MLKLFLNTTDTFLCNRVKNIFEKVESSYMQKDPSVDVLLELEKLQDNPLGCTIGNKDAFENSVKMKIKLIVGFFFVLIPLLGFGILAHLSNLDYAYSVLMTLGVAFFVSMRLENIVKRYAQTRNLQAAY